MVMDEQSKFTDLKASVVPKKDIAFADFDFDLHVKKEYLGAQSDKLTYKGQGKFGGTDFTFNGPIKMVKLQYSLGKKFNQEMKYDANIFDLKEYIFDVSASDLVVEGAELSAGDKETLIKLLTDKVESIKDKCLAGKDEIVPEFPMDTVVPFVGLFYAVQFAEKVEMTDNFIEMGASLKHFEMLTDKQNNLLKPIEGAFHNDVNKNGE